MSLLAVPRPSRLSRPAPLHFSTKQVVVRVFALLAGGWSLLLCGFGSPALADTAQLPDFRLQSNQLKAIDAASAPPVRAVADVLIDDASRQVLLDKQSHLRWPPASTAKIMTALLTLESGGLDALVTVSPVAAAEEGTRMGLDAGEVLNVRQLLYGLLLPSGNDAAIALAERDGPSAAFVGRMNERAQQLGLADTHFVNPDGLDDDQQVTSASDLARLAHYALSSQPLFAAIVKTSHQVIPAEAGHPAFDLTNLNQLLGTYLGADGVKTGTTPAAGQNLVASATRDGHRLLAVVLGSDDRYSDAMALLDHGFSSYAWWQPALGYQAQLVSLTPTAPAPLFAWQTSQVRTFADPDALTATFTLFGQPLASVPMRLAATTP